MLAGLAKDRAHGRGLDTKRLPFSFHRSASQCLELPMFGSKIYSQARLHREFHM